jgi:ketosteroid isomerase-like protein
MRIRTVAALAVPALALACQPATLNDAHRGAIESEIEQLYTEQAALLSSVDVDAWLAEFEQSEDFTYAGNGEVTRGFTAMAEDTRAYFANFESGEFAWGDLYIEVLASDAACVTSTWEWSGITVAGDTEDAEGTWTVVLRKHDGVWKIAVAAESYPPTPAME